MISMMCIDTGSISKVRHVRISKMCVNAGSTHPKKWMCCGPIISTVYTNADALPICWVCWEPMISIMYSDAETYERK